MFHEWQAGVVGGAWKAASPPVSVVTAQVGEGREPFIDVADIAAVARARIDTRESPAG